MKKLTFYQKICLIIAFLATRRPVWRLFFSKKVKNRFALVEHAANFHDECLPSWIKLLNDLGYGVDVFLTQTNYDKGIFVLLPPDQFDYRVFIISDTTNNEDVHCFLFFEKFWGYRNYKGVVFNSLFEWNIDFLMKTKFPKNAFFVLHAASRYLKKEIFQAFFNYPTSRRIPIVLAKNLAKKTLPKDQHQNWISPCFVGIVSANQDDTQAFLFAVQGFVKYQYRNYMQLLPLTDKLFFKDQKITLVGNISDNDGPDFEAKIKALKKEAFFDLSDHLLTYSEFYAKIKQAKFLNTIIASDELLEKYTNQISAAIPLSLALNRPLIINEKLAKFYDLNASTTILFHNNLFKAVEEAVNLSDAQYKELKKNNALLHENLLSQSFANLKRLIIN